MSMMVLPPERLKKLLTTFKIIGPLKALGGMDISGV